MPKKQLPANKILTSFWEPKCGFKLISTYRRLPELLYSNASASHIPNPHLLLLNQNLAEELGLNFSQIPEEQCAQLFCGNILPRGAQPLAQAYAGHQFGHFTMLGDGRALLWGEHITPNNQHVDLCFKGSGRTPYSRSGDGKAALGPMLREYLISEAMHALGVPTTRSLAVTATNTIVQREKNLPGAILTRVASSHLRIGTFEFAAQYGGSEVVQKLLDYAVARHYPELTEQPDKALRFLEAVMERHIKLIIEWERVGFIHGVMNTDNMSIAGETLDYGPCAFLDSYNSRAVFSSIDTLGRYAYSNQPQAAHWNLAVLAQALLDLISPDEKKATEMALEVLAKFKPRYEQEWLSMFRSKIGLKKAQQSDASLINELLVWMEKNQVDYNNTFLRLMGLLPLEGLFQEPSFQQWHQEWLKRTQKEGHYGSFEAQVNPLVIPRNHNVEAALNGSLAEFQNLLSVLQQPYHHTCNMKLYQEPPQAHERIYQTFCGT